MTLPHSSSYIPYSQRPWALHCSCQQETLRYQYSSGGKTVPRQISDPVSFSERERGKKRNKKKKNEQGPELGLVNHTCTTRHRAHRAAPHHRTHTNPAHTCFPVPASRGEHLSDWGKKLSATGPPAPARFWWALLLFWRGLTWAGWRARGGYDCGVGVGVEVNHRALCHNRAYVCVFRFMYVCIYTAMCVAVAVDVGGCACGCVCM